MNPNLNRQRNSRGRIAVRAALGTLPFAALALAAGMAIRATSVSTPTMVEAADSNPAELPPPQVLPAQPAHDSTAPLEQTVRGVRITVSNPRLEGRVAKFDLCYHFPGPGNWLPRGIALQVGGKRIIDQVSGFPIQIRGEPIDGRQLVTTFRDGKETEEWQPAAPGARASRCDTLSFAIGATPGKPARFELSIEALRYLPDEGFECQEYLAGVQSILEAAGSGIRLACTQEEWGANLTIEEFPSTMTQAQAEELFNSASDHYFNFYGPWKFSGAFEG